MCRYRPLAVLAVLLVPSAAVACLWDFDTLQQERSRFPDALELITGKFLRHSPEFYEWRAKDRRAKLAAAPTNLAYRDDLAVALDKLGRHDEAITVATESDRLRPGRYESAANLGTFLIHAGRLEDGLAHIRRAIALNPDAHFGREVYQAKLVEYVLSRRKDGKLVLPLSGPHAGSFARFVLEDAPPPALAERQAAIKGVLGMMRFGHHDSPVLLDALGSLLADRPDKPDADAKRLAARAYLKASYEAKETDAVQKYRARAKEVLEMQSPRRDAYGQMALEDLEADFKRELVEAKAWYDELRQKEIGWVRDGADPDAEFAKLYAADPAVSAPPEYDGPTVDDIYKRAILTAGAVVGLGLLGTLTLAGVLIWRVYRGRVK
ncbi:MAG: hypothetical protein U0871_17145 [Gemmataceae bacterium]